MFAQLWERYRFDIGGGETLYSIPSVSNGHDLTFIAGHIECFKCRVIEEYWPRGRKDLLAARGLLFSLVTPFTPHTCASNSPPHPPPIQPRAVSPHTHTHTHTHTRSHLRLPTTTQKAIGSQRGTKQPHFPCILMSQEATKWQRGTISREAAGIPERGATDFGKLVLYGP